MPHVVPLVFSLSPPYPCTVDRMLPRHPGPLLHSIVTSLLITLLSLGSTAAAATSPGTATSETGTAPISIATWNVAWLANEPLPDLAAVQACRAEARDRSVSLDARPTVACRKGEPFRMAGAYALLARHVRHYDFDLIGFQEIEGEPALAKILGDAPLSSGDAAGFAKAGTYFYAVNKTGGWQKVGFAVKRALLRPGTNLNAQPFDALGAPLARDKRGGLDVTVPLIGGDLRVLVVHLKSRCAAEPLDTAYPPNTPSENQHCVALSAQAPILANWIKARQEEGKPYLVIGDWNRALANDAALCTPGTDCKTKALAPWIDGNGLIQVPILVPTTTITHPEGCFNPRYGNQLIEHILLGGGAERGFVANSTTSHQYLSFAGGVTPIVDHAKTGLLSDHCPVSIRLGK